MNTHALIVPKQEVDAVWIMVSGLVDSALKHSNNEIDTESVYSFIKDGRMTLWIVVREDGGVMGAVVTEFIQYPLLKVCRIVALGGYEMSSWMHHIEDVEQWASAHGCGRMDALCRAGFEARVRHLGYTKDYIHMGKAL